MIVAETATGVSGVKPAAIKPPTKGGMSWPKAMTEALMPNTSPWIVLSAEREIKPVKLAKDSPLQIATKGTSK